MTQLILATSDKTRFADLQTGLHASGGTIGWAASGRDVIDAHQKRQARHNHERSF